MVEAAIFENSLRDPWEFAFGGFRLLHSLIPDELLSDGIRFPMDTSVGASAKADDSHPLGPDNQCPTKADRETRRLPAVTWEDVHFSRVS